MIDERDFFLHFNEFKKYVKDAEPITILKDIEIISDAEKAKEILKVKD